MEEEKFYYIVDGRICDPDEFARRVQIVSADLLDKLEEERKQSIKTRIVADILDLIEDNSEEDLESALLDFFEDLD